MKCNERIIETKIQDYIFENWEDINNFSDDLDAIAKKHSKFEITYETLLQIKKIIKLAGEYALLNKNEEMMEQADKILGTNEQIKKKTTINQVLNEFEQEPSTLEEKAEEILENSNSTYNPFIHSS